MYLVATALTPPHITGTTPPQINCPNSLCDKKLEGKETMKFQAIQTILYNVLVG